MGRIFWILCVLASLSCGAGAASAKDEKGGSGKGILLVENGVAKSAIVIPDKSTPVVDYAARELQHHIEKASGAKLPVIREGEYKGAGGVIFLGQTDALRKSGLAKEWDPLTKNVGDFWVSGANWKDDLDHFKWSGQLHENNLYFFGTDTDRAVEGSTSGAAGTLYAVYDFLESALGVRWIWPGENGEHVPVKKTIFLSDYSESGKPRFRNSVWRTQKEGRWTLKTPSGWKSQAARKAFHEAQEQWLLRQRFRRLSRVAAGHAFEQFWKQYHQTEPDIFARLPNGKRERLPGDRRDGIDMAMCLSNPRLHGLVVENWMEKSPATAAWADPKVVNATGNDVSERCTCEACRKWDAPDPLFATHPYWGKGEIRKEFRFMSDGPSLSDRYAKFALAILEEAREKFRPDAEVAILAYTNYSKPPKETTLGPDFTVGIVEWSGINPWGERTEGDLDALKDLWTGWQKTGANLFLRPNTFHTGWNMPVYYADRIGDGFSYCAAEGMIDTDFDALMGQWAVQAPNYYVLGRKHVRPEMATEDVLDEFYAFFGGSGPDIRRYFDHWRDVCSRVSVGSRDGMIAEHAGILEGQGVALWGWTDSVFTPGDFKKGREILAEAKSSASENSRILERVEVLDLGLQLAEKMAATVTALKSFEKNPSSVTRAKLEQTFDDMKKFRESHEARLLTNVGYLHLKGDLEFTRRLNMARAKSQLLPIAEEIGVLPLEWTFRKDPENAGISGNWMAKLPDDQWQPIRVDADWTKQDAGKGFHGIGWYALNPWKLSDETALKMKEFKASGASFALLFGAIDGKAEVFLNGKKIGAQSLPEEVMWDQPFTIALPDDFDPSAANDLKVRVVKPHSAAGIWKPVKLVTIAKSVD